MTIRKWFALLALLPVLMFFAESVLSAPETRPAHWIARTLFAAGGFYQPYNVLDYGATGDGTTNDAPAINAMFEIVCASSGPRKAYFPAADYRVGLDGTNKVVSGIQVECGDIEIYGDGVKSRILNGGDNGNYGMYVCSDLTDISATCSSSLENIYIHELMFEDDDPVAHGHSKFTYVDEGSLAGGTPAWNDSVTWTGGTGTVEYYNAVDGRIGIIVDSGTLIPPEDITDATWTATGAGQVVNEVPTTEESHGIGSKNTKHLLIENVYFKSIADESIDLTRNVTFAMLRNINAQECSQVGGGGACIHFGDGSSGTIEGGYFSGGQASIGGGGSLIAIATESTADSPVGINGVTIRGGYFEELDTAAADAIEDGIQIAASQEPIENILIDSVQMYMDNLISDAIDSSGAGNNVSLNVANSKIRGNLSFLRAHDISFTGGSVTTTDARTNGFEAIDKITGGSWSAANATNGVIQAEDEGFTITGATVYGGLNDCIVIAGASSHGATVTGNICPENCGTGSTAHHCVSANSTNFAIVTGNIYRNNTAGSGFLVGSAAVVPGEGCINTAAGTKSICDNNSVENTSTTTVGSRTFQAQGIVITTNGAYSPTMNGQLYIADHATPTSNTDYSLPNALTGMHGCFYDNGDGDGGIIIDAATGDGIILPDGTVNPNGEAIDSPGVAGAGPNGDAICLTAVSLSRWVTTEASGTWVGGGAN